jgi:diacylglycerol kinase (ATP)
MTGTPVGLISNPRSGHNRKQFADVRAAVAACAAIHHVVTECPQQIAPALRELAAGGIRVLAINGGDGTCSRVLGEVLESRLFDPLPQIVLLPGGTANMNAGDIGMRGSLRRAVSHFRDWCESDCPPTPRVAERALLRVVPAAGGEARYGMFLGGGAVIGGTEYAHREIHSRGLRDDFSLALGTARTFWGLWRDDPAFARSVGIDLSLDGGPRLRRDTLILAVSTLSRLAFGMRPFWGAGPGDIRLTLVERNCRYFGRTFPGLLRGRPGRHAHSANGYHSVNAAGMELAMSGQLNLDGEILSVTEGVSVTASPRMEFLLL